MRETRPRAAIATLGVLLAAGGCSLVTDAGSYSLRDAAPSDADASDASSSDAGSGDAGSGDALVDAAFDARVDGDLDAGDAAPDAFVPVDAGPIHFDDLAMGHSHSCGVARGALYCWGSNDFGQLGREEVVAGVVRVEFATGVDAVRVSVGEGFTCVVGDDTKVYCAGLNFAGALGQGVLDLDTVGRSFAPVRGYDRNDLTGALDVVSATLTTCARLSSGVSCWGHPGVGLLGRVTTETEWARSVLLSTRVTNVWLSNTVGCAEDGDTLQCWGDDSHGAVGDGPTNSTGMGPRAVMLASPPTDLATNTAGLCGTVDGTLMCWGRMGMSDVATPTAFTLPLPVQEIELAEATGIATTSEGDMLAWGVSAYGIFGNGEAFGAPRAVPATPADVANWTLPSDFVMSPLYTAGAPSGDAWGNDAFGAVGQLPVVRRRASPPTVPAATLSPVSMSVGADFACGIFRGMPNSELRCAGLDGDGFLVTGVQSGEGRAVFASPTLGNEYERPVELAVGRAHVCAITLGVGRYVRCWGDSGPMELSATASETARRGILFGGTNVRFLASGADFSCWVPDGDDDHVRCVGETSFGRRPTFGDLDIPDTAQVSLGEAFGCARSTAGVVRCWGDSRRGQTTRPVDATDAIRRTPIVVSFVPDPVDAGVGDAGTPSMAASHLCTGLSHACAVVGQQVWCWGDNRRGQLGSASGELSLEPVVVPGIAFDGARDLSCGAEHTCLVRDDGTVRCWGSDRFGQLGDASDDTNPGIDVVGVTDVHQLSRGPFARSVFAFASDGSHFSAWGNNHVGLLGVGDGIVVSEPVRVRGL